MLMYFGLPRWLSGKKKKKKKKSTYQCRRLGFDSWLERLPGEGNGNLLQCSCLEYSMNREAWQVTVLGVTKS